MTKILYNIVNIITFHLDGSERTLMSGLEFDSDRNANTTDTSPTSLSFNDIFANGSETIPKSRSGEGMPHLVSGKTISNNNADLIKQ